MPDRLKIFSFIDNFAPITETFVYDHAVHLARHHDVLMGIIKRENEHVFSFDKIVQLPFKESKIWKIIRSRGFKHHIGMNFANRGFRNALKQILISFQPDIIHCHFGNKAIFLLDNLDRIDFRGPIFITFYGYDASQLLWQRPAYQRKIRKILSERYIYPIFVSEHLRSNFIKLDIETSRSQVIHLGTDTSFFRQRSKSKNPGFHFVQIGGFREKKGHRYTLEAFARLVNEYPEYPWKLTFGGGGQLENEMRRLAVDLKIASRVIFRGWVNKEQIRQLLEDADAFLHFSITSSLGDQEGLPVAITEAMSMELPVCATVHSGITEIIEDGVNGILVQEKKIDQYVEAMKAIIHWGRKPINRKKVVDHFSHQSYLDNKLISFYRLAIKEQLPQ